MSLEDVVVPEFPTCPWCRSVLAECRCYGKPGSRPEANPDPSAQWIGEAFRRMSEPADELRDAARWLRIIAETATPGPWDTETEPRHIRGNGGRNYVTDTSDGVHDYENARYITAMHPGVALALAESLDHAAEHWHDTFTTPPLLTLARLVIHGSPGADRIQHHG